MGVFFCEHCKKDTQFLPILNTIQIAGVSRSTLYYWMDHAWVHWRILASGRRVICQESLSHRAPQNLKTDVIGAANSVRKRPTVSNQVG